MPIKEFCMKDMQNLTNSIYNHTNEHVEKKNQQFLILKIFNNHMYSLTILKSFDLSHRISFWENQGQIDFNQFWTMMSVANERLLVHSKEQFIPPAMEINKCRLKNGIKHQWAVCTLPFCKSCLPFSISSATSGAFALLLTDIDITDEHNKSSAAIVFKPLPGVVSIYLRQIMFGKSKLLYSYVI